MRPFVLFGLCCFVGLAAQQLQQQVLVSPIVDEPFNVTLIPTMMGRERVIGDAGPADMGVDTDGCRHSSGPSEYEFYVAVCPYTFFSAMTVEYQQTNGEGRGLFLGEISDDFKEWIRSKDGFNTTFQTNKQKFYKAALRHARASGSRLPDFQDWVIPQDMIPVEQKYRLALKCYEKRGASASTIGKLALSGTWAVRARLNKSILDVRLAGGIEEVNTRLLSYIEDGETFTLDKYYDAYKRIYQRGLRTDEGQFIAGITYFGFALRKGDLREALGILGEMSERFDEETDMHKFLRGIIRTRRQTTKIEYVHFLSTVATNMINALANEEFPRPMVPQTMLVVAESLRRLSRYEEAAGWYLALGQLEETEPRLREEIRAKGKKPNSKASFPMLLGWQADDLYQWVAERLREDDKDPETVTNQRHARLLNDLVHEGLGTPDYVSPTWKPETGAGWQKVRGIMRQAGLAVLDYVSHAKRWPERLDDLWMAGLIKYRNELNRFYCPASGKALVYKPIGGDIESLPLGTVLIASPEPVPFQGGTGYALFLSNLDVVFSPRYVPPGDIFRPKAGGKD